MPSACRNPCPRAIRRSGTREEDAPVFIYRCPGGGKLHQVNATYERAYVAPCLRCREVVHVTEELVTGARGAPATTSAGAAWASRKTRPGERIQPAAARVTRPDGSP